MHWRGEANAPYEFGVKVSIVTTNARAPGGQFVACRGAAAQFLRQPHPARRHRLNRKTRRLDRVGLCRQGYRRHETRKILRRVFISVTNVACSGSLKKCDVARDRPPQAEDTSPLPKIAPAICQRLPIARRMQPAIRVWLRVPLPIPVEPSHASYLPISHARLREPLKAARIFWLRCRFIPFQRKPSRNLNATAQVGIRSKG